MGQWLVQWTPIGDHCIVFVLSWCLSSPRCINGYCYTSIGAFLFVYLFIYLFFTFIPNALEPFKTPLKGP